jgi:predicted ATPase
LAAPIARKWSAVAAVHGLSAETAAAIVAKTDGVALFVEELTKSVLEAPSENGATVPTTLKDSLMARLDRLGDAREVAQIAAVFGRQFGFALLDAVAQRRGDELETALPKLVAAGIVFPEGRGLERSFSFKHALVCDAAYESLLLAWRRDLHQRIAQTLEERFPETAASEPELLAYHFGRRVWQLRRAITGNGPVNTAPSRSSYQEAIAHYSGGLEEAGRLREESERQQRPLAFLLKLGPAFTIVAGAPSAQVEETYRRAAELGDALEDAAATYKAKWGLWLNAVTAHKAAAAREKADELWRWRVARTTATCCSKPVIATG